MGSYVEKWLIDHDQMGVRVVDLILKQETYTQDEEVIENYAENTEFLDWFYDNEYNTVYEDYEWDEQDIEYMKENKEFFKDVFDVI